MTADTSTMGRSGTAAQYDTDDDGPDDPRHLVLPHVDTSIDISGEWVPFKVSVTTALLAAPGALAIIAGLWAGLQGSIGLALGLLVLGIAAGMIAMIGAATAGWAVYPHERVLDAIHHARRRMSLPWGYTEAVEHAADLHGIERVITVEVGETNPESFAGVRCHDGRAIVPIRLSSENTEFLHDGELAQLCGSVTQAIDSEITTYGHPISVYSTTRPAVTDLAAEYVTRAEAVGTRLSPYLAGMLGEVGGWVADRDDETGANETHDYLLVTAGTKHHGEFDTQADDLEHRIEQALAAVGQFDTSEASPCSVLETVNLAAEFWERTAYPETPAGESAATASLLPVDIADAPDEEPGTTDVERALSPEWYAERSRHVEVGDAVARTFWISNWPVEPPERFLHGLYTLPGVDLDVTIYGHPKAREDVVDTLKRTIPKIDAEGMDRAESMDVESLTIDDNLSAYVLAYKLLQSVNTQPWGISGYVTVRAPDEEKLREACERVEKELKAPPATCTPSAPFGDQHTTFRSAAPFGRDYYAAKGDVRRRATKTHLALGGFFGAALPAATPETSDEGGIRWGRDVTTGRSVEVDPFGQGMAPHLITVGPSGSGKTFSVKQASQEWWLNGDDRTVIYCDTQGGFEDVVEAFDAEHIVIDGQTGINPLDIRPAAAHDRAATSGGIDQYRLKVTEATEFFKGIIRSHGVDPGRFHSDIEQAVEQTYADAGISSDPATHSRGSPDPADLFETIEDMVEHPNEYTFTDTAAEVGQTEERIGDLLGELSGFQEGGKYHNILNETTSGLSPDCDAAYLDMRQLAGQTGGAKSVNLQLAVGQVTQLIKQTEGETIFVVDEAHNLLHSPEMVSWLNKAAREWRRYDAALWFVTQSPQEFVRNDGSEGEENKRETIVEQCSTIQIMNAPKVDAGTLTELGVPPQHTGTVQNDLVSGSDGKGYSECILSFKDERGWIRTRVEANPIHAASIEFSYRETWSYTEQMANALADADDAIDEMAIVDGTLAEGAPAHSVATDGGGDAP